MKEQSKPNDILVATLQAPDASILDLAQNDITSENTQLLTKEDYKETPFVKNIFTKDGVFQEEMFNKTYDLALLKYEDLLDKYTYDELGKYLEYSPTSKYKPLEAKTYEPTYEPVKLKNPLSQTYSLTGFDEVGDPTITEKEAAQSHNIWDPVNKNWLEETPESRNFLKKSLGETLVYAKYDKDGYQENPVTGDFGMHTKGEWITDKNGNYFTELLGDREVLDKEVVVLGDVLTKEGSAINKLDFFDSDGYDKSIGGIAMKSLVSVAPYLIPGVNSIWGGITAAFGLAGVMPTVYKSLESLVLGENTTSMTKAATKMENWFRKFDNSKSKHGSSSFWTIESLGELISDTCGQLWQQQAAAKLAPKILKKFDPNVEKLLKILKEGSLAATALDKLKEAKMLKNTAEKINLAGLRLSLGYMALISADTIYNDALNAGYDRRTAGIASLASMGLLYKIMNFNETTRGIGTWFLDKTTGYSEGFSATPLMKLARSEYKNFAEGVKKANSGDKSLLAYKLREFKGKAALKMDEILRVNTAPIWGGMLKEGIEEVTEEITQDTIKGMIDTLSWLGYTKKEGSFGGWDNVFSKEGLSRYLATFVGGALGGGLFAGQRALNNKIEEWKNPELALINAQDKELTMQMAEVILTNREDQFYKEVDKVAKLLSNSLDTTTVLAKGENLNIGLQGKSFSSVVKELIHKKMDYIKTQITQAVGDFGSLSDFLKKALAREFANVFIDSDFDEKYLLKQWANSIDNLVDLKQKYETLKSKEDKDLSDVEKQLKQLLKDDIAKAVQDVNDFYNGKHYIEYILDGELLFNPDWAKSLIPTVSTNPNERDNTDIYALFEYGVMDYENRSAEEKLRWKAELKELNETTFDPDNLIDILPRLRKIAMNILRLIKDDVSEFTQSAHLKKVLAWVKKSENQKSILEKLINNIEEDEALSDEDKQAKIDELYGHFAKYPLFATLQHDPKIWTMEDRLDFDLFKAIKPILTLKGFNAELEKILGFLINDLAAQSRITEWTEKALDNLIDTVNKQLADTSDPYIIKLKELADTSDTALNIDFYAVSIKKKTASVLKKIDGIRYKKLDAFLKHAAKHQDIDEDLKKIIITHFEKRILTEINKIGRMCSVFNFEQMFSYTKKPSNYDPVGNPYTDELKLALIINELSDPDSDLNQNLEELFLDTGVTSMLPAGSTYDTIFGNLVELATLLKSIYEKKVVKNPIMEAIKKVYTIINPSDASQSIDIISLIADKSKSLTELSHLLTFKLKDKERSVLSGAMQALTIVQNAIQGMQAKHYSGQAIRVHHGITQLMRQYAKAYTNEDENQFLVIDPEDAEIIQNEIEDIKSRLVWLYDLNAQIQSNNQDLINRRNFIKGYSLILAKEIKIIGNLVLPPVPADKIPNEPKYLEEFIAKREEEIYNVLKQYFDSDALRDEVAETGDTEELIATKKLHKIIDQLVETFTDKDCEIIFTDFLEKGLTDNKHFGIISLEHEDNPTVNKYFLATRILSLLNYSAKDADEDLKEILANNKTAKPKFDQEIVIRLLLGWAKNKDGFAYFTNKITDRINKTKPKHLLKQSAPNITTIFGPAGSGKTFIIHLVKDKLKEYGLDLEVSALSEEKVKDLKTDSGLEGKTIRAYIGDTLFAQADSISEAIETSLSKLLPLLFGKIIKSKDDVINLIKGEFSSAIVILPDSAINSYSIEINLGDIDSKNCKDCKIIIPIEPEETSNELKLYTFSYKLELSTDVINSLPKLDKDLIIDECTLLSLVLTLFLIEMAKKGNKNLILIGDPFLQVHSLMINNIKQDDFALTLYIPYGTTILSATLRFNNTAKEENLKRIYNALVNISRKNDLPYEILHNVDGMHFDENVLAPLLKAELKLHQLEYQVIDIDGKKSLIGDLLTYDLNTFEESLKIILTEVKSNGKSAAVILDNVTGPERTEIENIIKKLDKDFDLSKITFTTLNDIQGGEKDYTINFKLNKDPETLNLVEDTRKIYTLLSRSRNGSLTFDVKTSGLFDDRLESTPNPSTLHNFYGESNFEEENSSRVEELERIINALSSNPGNPQPPQGPINLVLGGMSLESGDNTLDQAEDQEEEGKPKIKISDVIFKNGSILQTWYHRLGVLWYTKNKSRSILDQQLKNNKHYLEFGLSTTNRKNPELEDLVFFMNSIYGLNFNGSRAYKDLTLEELANLFLEFKNAQLETLLNSNKLQLAETQFRIKIVENNKDDESPERPYKKINDNNLLNVLQLILVKVENNGYEGWITLGLLGYNLAINVDASGNAIIDASGNPELVNISKQQADLYSAFINNGRKPIIKNFHLSPFIILRILNEVNEFYRQRGIKSLFRSNNNMLILGTSLRYLRLHRDIPRNVQLTKDTSGSGVDWIDEYQYGKGRYTLSNILNWGYKISNEKIDIWDPNDYALLSEDERLKKFVEWYSECRAGDLSIKLNNNLKYLCNKIWITIIPKGFSDDSYLKLRVLLNKIEPNFLTNLPTTTNGNIKGITYNNLQRAIIALINKNLNSDQRKLFESILNIWNDTHQVNKSNDALFIQSILTLDSLKILEIVVASKNTIDSKTITDLFTLINNLLLTELNNDQAAKDQIKNLCNYSIAHDIAVSETRSGNAIVNGKFTQDLEFLDDATGCGLLIKALLSNKFFNNFFFDAVRELDLNAIVSSAENYIISYFYETPNIYLNWDSVIFDNENPDTNIKIERLNSLLSPSNQIDITGLGSKYGNLIASSNNQSIDDIIKAFYKLALSGHISHLEEALIILNKDTVTKKELNGLKGTDVYTASKFILSMIDNRLKVLTIPGSGSGIEETVKYNSLEELITHFDEAFKDDPNKEYIKQLLDIILSPSEVAKDILKDKNDDEICKNIANILDSIVNKLNSASNPMAEIKNKITTKFYDTSLLFGTEVQDFKDWVKKSAKLKRILDAIFNNTKSCKI